MYVFWFVFYLSQNNSKKNQKTVAKITSEFSEIIIGYKELVEDSFTVSYASAFVLIQEPGYQMSQKMLYVLQYLTFLVCKLMWQEFKQNISSSMENIVSLGNVPIISAYF